MKKIIFSIFLSFLFYFSTIAQQNHFIYLQTEGKQPFYVKLDKKILSSSSAGYLIIPKLTEGNYTLLLGFPKNEWAEQSLDVTIQKNDIGYLVKNFNEKGWALVDMNSYQIIYNKANQSIATKPAEKPQPPVITPPTEVVKEAPKPITKEEPKPIVKETEKEIVKEQPKPIVKEQPPTEVIKELPKPIVNPSAQQTAKETATQAVPKEEGATIAKITKLFTSKSNTGFEMVYQVKNNSSVDTVRIFIPIQDNITQTPITTPPIEVVKETAKPIIKEEPKPAVKEAEKETVKEQPKPFTKEQPPIEEVKNTVKEVVPTPTKSSHQANCKNLANEEDYKKLRKKMASADTDNEMLYRAFTTFQKQCYTTDQIKTLSFLFLTDDGKYKFFDTAYPYVYDIDNFPKLAQLLSEEYYIKRFNAMLKN
jgi:Domain of unknown function (DUF4476)